MSSITIHGLDEDLDRVIREQSHLEGKSINKTIKSLLRKALRLDSSKPPGHKDDFQSFCGAWSEEQLREFDMTISDMGHIDPEEWS